MTTSSNIDLTPAQYKEVIGLLDRYLPNTTVWAYGSRANWSARPDSDLDIVAFARTEQQTQVSLLREAFEESSLPFSVDFFVWESVPEQFRKNIEEGHVVLVEKADKDIQSSWRSSKWGDEISLKYGKSLKGYREGKGKYRVYGSNGPVGWADAFLSEGPGVILGRKGAHRGVQFSTNPFYVIDTAYFVKPKTNLNMRWLFYAVKYYRLGEIDDGSPIPSTTRSAVYVRDIKVPSASEQKAIAHILGTLDDKIELNRQMNATLESMAQALFKSWFVDFDPVIDNALAAGNPIPEALQAKAATRQGLGEQRKLLPETIRQQFPSRFDFSKEMDWIPEGWAAIAVSEALQINPKVKLSKEVVAKFTDMKALPTSGYSISNVIEKEYTGGAKFQQFDILLARITPCLENGKTGIADFLEGDEVGFGSTEFIILRGHGEIKMPFVACLARDENFRKHCIQNMVGTSGRQRVQNSCFDSYFLALPSDENVLTAFHQQVNSNFSKKTANKNESKSLESLRDTLLPKLLSGELRIPEAEQLVANTQ